MWYFILEIKLCRHRKDMSGFYKFLRFNSFINLKKTAIK